jgi:copper transport protein
LRRTPKWSLLGLIGALALAIIFGVRQTHTADAHAVLERSEPAQGAQLKTAPALVKVWFSEAIERKLTKLLVLDTTGKQLQSGATQFSDSDPLYAAVALPSTVGPGVYAVGYQNVSKVDGHAWTGSISFIVLNADGTVPTGTAFHPPGAKQGYLPGVGDNTLRWFAMLASVMIAGAAAFYLFVARPAAEFLQDDEIERVEDSAMAISGDLIVIAVPVLVLSVIGQAFLLADRLGGPGKLGDIFFNTRTGELWVVRLGLSIALLLLFLPAIFSERYRRGDRTRLVMAMALVGGSGLLMTYSLNSHAGTGGGEFWAVSSDFVHFLATSAWLGALIELPLLFWWTKSKLDEEKRLLYLANVLDRFAWLAVISVTLLIGTGVFNGFVQLPSKEALWETTYGRVLIAKLALILPLLGIAGLNAVFIAPRLSDAIDALHEEDPDEQASPQDRPRFQRQLQLLQAVLPKTIALELILGAAVLVSVAVLTQTTTAKGEVREAAGKPHGQYIATDLAKDLNTELRIAPFGIGLSTFTVTMEPQAGGELGEVLDIRLRAFFDDPATTAGSAGTDQDLKATSAPAVWDAEAALLTQPGDWRLEARIQRRGVDDVTARYTVSRVGGVLADRNQPNGLFDLPFTFVDWNIVAGGAMVAFGVAIYLIYRNRPRTWQRSTGWSVAASAAVSLIAGATLLFGVHSHTKVVSIKPATAESIQNGQQLFTTNCVVCHGANGRGNGGRGADLTQHVPYHNDTRLWTWITQGIPLDSKTKRMPSFKNTLSADERWDVVNYLRSAFGDIGTPVYPDTPTPAP